MKPHIISLEVIVLLVVMFVVPVKAEVSVSPAHIQLEKPIDLKIEEALLTVHNNLDKWILVNWTSQQCYNCLYQKLGWLRPGRSVNFAVSTPYELTLRVIKQNNQICNVTCHFGEGGNYSLWVRNQNNNSEADCSIVIDADPVNSYKPLLIAFLVLSGLALAYAIGKTVLGLNVVRRFLLRLSPSTETEQLINSELGSPSRSLVSDNIPPPPPPGLSYRLRSLATFRGIVVVVLVFTNSGGGRYWFFRHSSWNGLTVADVAFPLYLFTEGITVTLSINTFLRSGFSRCILLKKVLCRYLIIFVIGIFIISPNYCEGSLSWENLRIPGVLQLFAWSCLVVSCLDLLVARAHLSADTQWFPVLDIVLYWPAWLCVILFEVFWLCTTFLLPVDGCPTGYLGPGGIGDMGRYVNCTGGAAGSIDRWLLGAKHLHQTATSQVIYKTVIRFDAEGVLGSINTILTVFLGLQAGKIILHYRDLHTHLLSRFFIWGLILGVISAILTKCTKEEGFIPVNKNLWSLSYVTTTSCFAFLLLMLLYYVTEVKKWWFGAPFYFTGMNPYIVYIGHEFFKTYFPFRWKMANSSTHAEYLAQNIVATFFWVFVSYILYRKRIIWKIYV